MLVRRLRLLVLELTLERFRPYLKIFPKFWSSLRKIGNLARLFQASNTKFEGNARSATSVFVDSASGAIVKWSSYCTARLIMRGELTTKSYKRSRAYAFLLLCLMAHALFVCFTHHHNVRPDLSSSATASISATGDSGSENSTDSSSDAHCLSCRLQRNLISDHPAASLIIAPIPEAFSREAGFDQLHSQRFFVSFFGRAPPTA